jgi:endonuclease-3
MSAMRQREKQAGSADQARAKEIIRRLRRQYPETRCALAYRTPLQLLVATILSAQCTDKKVNEVTPTLFERYKTAEDFARAGQQEFEQQIRQTGFFRNKAKNIIAAARRICEAYAGSVPDSMAELITLPGVARKTANIVLSSAFRKAEGIAVDTHVKRLAQRLGLSRAANPDKIEEDLLKIVPRKDWLDINYLLVDHGRRICDAKKPRCPACVLKDLCPSAAQFLSPSP